MNEVGLAGFKLAVDEYKTSKNKSEEQLKQTKELILLFKSAMQVCSEKKEELKRQQFEQNLNEILKIEESLNFKIQHYDFLVNHTIDTIACIEVSMESHTYVAQHLPPGCTIPPVKEHYNFRIELPYKFKKNVEYPLNFKWPTKISISVPTDACGNRHKIDAKEGIQFRPTTYETALVGSNEHLVYIGRLGSSDIRRFENLDDLMRYVEWISICDPHDYLYKPEIKVEDYDLEYSIDVHYDGIEKETFGFIEQKLPKKFEIFKVFPCSCVRNTITKTELLVTTIEYKDLVSKEIKTFYKIYNRQNKQIVKVNELEEIIKFINDLSQKENPDLYLKNHDKNVKSKLRKKKREQFVKK